MTKPRILYLCGQAPWTRTGGAVLRNYWMIAALSKCYAVDLVTADTDYPVPGDFAAMIDDYAAFPRVASARGGFGSLMRAASPNGSALTAGWTSPALREYVADRLGRHPYAAIQVDLPMHAALPRRDAIPIVYNAHSCESAFLARRAMSEPPHLAPLLTIDAMKVRAIERQLVNRSALVAACVEDDVRDFERFVPSVRKKVSIVPDGVDVAQFAAVRQSTAQPRTISIMGNMDVRSNQVGLRWFLRSILPSVRAAMPDVSVRVAGRMQPAFVAELQTYANVDPFPNPESTIDHLAAATAVVAPIVGSGGPRSRILEAWAAGRPVITTTAGAVGLTYEDRRELLVRDNPSEFADGIVQLVQNASLRESLVDYATRRVQNYDWNAIGGWLRDAYAERVGGDAGSRVPTISEEVVLAGRF